MSAKQLIRIAQEKHAHESEFLQTFSEVCESLETVFVKHPEYVDVMRQMMEPERIHQFRVVWLNDKNEIQVNIGYRVQYNSAIGPYKGGLRFHPSVNLSILKFLGFEQIFKNSLTGLAIGGGKGGSDFDPKGKSEAEVMKFCQAFMTELAPYIGDKTDVPAGDIGVGGREIGYMFGQYKKLKARHEAGALTGKGIQYGGSLIRTEATGYGVAYFTQEMVRHFHDSTLEGKRFAVSGSGNVAQFCCEKLIELGATVLTMSDSQGTVYFADGMTENDLQYLMDLKNTKRGRLSEIDKSQLTACAYSKAKPCGVAKDLFGYIPCATQNEVDINDAKQIAKLGCSFVVEGSNMPLTIPATEYLMKQEVLIGPAKAANAGGVSVSALEMAQNASRSSWTRERVDEELRTIMKNIFVNTVEAAKEYLGNGRDICGGANIAGFLKVAKAMAAQGPV